MAADPQKFNPAKIKAHTVYVCTAALSNVYCVIRVQSIGGGEASPSKTQASPPLPPKINSQLQFIIKVLRKLLPVSKH